MTFDLNASRPVHLAAIEALPENANYVLLAYVPDPDAEFRSYAVSNVGTETIRLMLMDALMELMTSNVEVQHFTADEPQP